MSGKGTKRAEGLSRGCRTSATHPITHTVILRPRPGTVSLSYCPGKSVRDRRTGLLTVSRSLAGDLKRLRDQTKQEPTGKVSSSENGDVRGGEDGKRDGVRDHDGGARGGCIGVTHVVSLLDLHESRLLGVQEEEAVCESLGLGFSRAPVVEMGAPADARAFRTVVGAVARAVCGEGSGAQVTEACRQYVASMPAGPHMRAARPVAKPMRGEAPHRGDDAGEPPGGATLDSEDDATSAAVGAPDNDDDEAEKAGNNSGNPRDATESPSVDSTAGDRPQHFLVHCRGGMGRAGLFAACVLLELGLARSGPIAVKMVRARRGKGAVESRAQEAFIDSYAQLVAAEPGAHTAAGRE